MVRHPLSTVMRVHYRRRPQPIDVYSPHVVQVLVKNRHPLILAFCTRAEATTIEYRSTHPPRRT